MIMAGSSLKITAYKATQEGSVRSSSMTTGSRRCTTSMKLSPEGYLHAQLTVGYSGQA